MASIEKAKKDVEKVWLKFEEDGSIHTYLSYQELLEKLELLEEQMTVSQTIGG